MATYTGVIKQNGLEGGFFELHTDGGGRYQLRGASPSALREGARVEVVGHLDDGGMGIGMTGPIIDVSAVKTL
jgi:hypothetical protein